MYAALQVYQPNIGYYFYCRIGLAIARRLGEDGAHVVISSRQQKKVDEVLSTLKSEKLSVSGMVCHVANRDHRSELVRKVTNNNVDLHAV